MIRFATFGRRTWAFLLTLLIDLAVLGGLWALVGEPGVAAAFLGWYAIHHVGLVMEGGTFGHRLAGLRVVRVDGSRPSLVEAIVREVARLGLSLPPLALGMLWMLDEPQRRTWHDLLAGTVVVRESSATAVAAPAWAEHPPWRERGGADPAPESPPQGAPQVGSGA